MFVQNYFNTTFWPDLWLNFRHAIVECECKQFFLCFSYNVED